MLFLDPAQMNGLTERLLQAAQHMSDPASEVQIALAEFGVLPEGVRAEVEGYEASLNAARSFAQERRDASAALAALDRICPGPRPLAYGEETRVIDMDAMIADLEKAD